jgi:ABC-type transporter Mla subunit MlaD
MTLTLLAMAIALVPAAWNFRKTYKKTTALLERIEADVMPLTKHAHAIADNLDYISTAIRADIGMIQDTLKSANRTIRGAVGTTEQKINEFNALLDVVQGEAEGLFVSTAATVRGVQTGASHLVRGDGTEIASVEVDLADLEMPEDDEETDDYGYDDSPESDDQPDATRAPRIIRRDRSRR